MRTALPERRGPKPNPSNGAAARFQDRGSEYRYERLKQSWTSCPACGGKKLERPTAAHLQLIPEAEGVCGTCGVMLMRTSDAKSHVLKQRRH